MRELKEILNSNNFKFNKAFGQNFITDKNLLKAIVADGEIAKDDVVVEIGAGGGTLTREIAAVAKKVISFEIDKNLEPILSEVLSEHKNVQVVFEDVMKIGIEEIKKLAGSKFKVVANLPYYITTPIIMMFLESDVLPQSLTVMVQKEVAERFTANANTADYGSITVAIDSRATAKITRIVKRNLFYPVPNVDSAIVHIKTEDKYQLQKQGKKVVEIFNKLYRAGFAMRRKTLANNILSSFAVDRMATEKLLQSADVDVMARGESLTTKKFIDVAKELAQYV